MTKKTAKEILNNLSENGKIGLAKSFQKLCIDCGIFMANESIAQIEVKQSFISKIFGKSEKTETKKSARKTVRKSEKKKTVQKAKKAKELDFYKFVSTDKTRPYIQGVYFDEGGKVATDGKILVRVKSDYDSSKEKQVIAKNQLPLDVQFPNYKRVIPDFSKMQEVDFDFQKVKDILKKNDRILKIFKKLSRNKIILHKLQNGTMVNNDYMQKILHFAECYSDCVLYVGKENTKMCALVSGDVDNPNAICLFMPCLQGENMTEIDDSLYLTGDFSDLSETDIIKGCKKKERGG